MTETIDQDVLLFDAAIERGPYWEATTPVAMGTMVYTNLIVNGGFETAGSGGTDVFGTWEETAGDGTIARSATGELFGSYHAVLTAGASANTKIAQTVNVTAGHHYAFVFHANIGAVGDNRGRYGVYDVTNGADIIARTTITRDTYLSVIGGPIVVPFTAPSGCASVRLDLWCSATNTDVTHYDGAALFDVGDGPLAVYDYTANGGGDVVGDVDARLAPLTIAQYAPNDTESRPIFDLDKMWIAARSEAKHPGVASFEPLLRFADAAAGTDAAGTADVDATGYTGAAATNILRVTPGTATWAERASITNASTTLGSANYGDYLWLLRARVSAGTWEVKIRWETSSMQYIEGPTVEVTNTDYMWQEMGIASFPPHNRQAITTAMHPEANANDLWALSLWGRRTDGSGALDLDCVGMLPIDEGAATIEDIVLVDGWRDTANRCYLLYANAPDGDAQALTLDHQYRIVETPAASGGVALPPGDGRLILFANGTADSSLTPFYGFQSGDTDNLASSQYYPRWLSLRGAE
jgi:hypothetical protein